jgi:hypothetical protein
VIRSAGTDATSGSRRRSSTVVPHLRRSAILAVAALGLLPGAAAAATVTATSYPPQDRYGGGGLAVKLQGGDSAEQIGATVSGRDLVLEDLQEPLTLSGDAACAVADEHHVRCSVVSDLSLAGGAGDDVIAVAGASSATADVTLEGESGDDRLLGGAGMDHLTGGPGDDVLDGGAGNDNLDGGPGADQVIGGEGADAITEDADDPGAADTLDGGPGQDHLLLASDPPAAMTLDLASGALSGAATARVTGFETVSGSLRPAQLTLLGSDGPDVLSDAGTIEGRGGDDQLSLGSGGGGRLAGGAGDDRLTGGPGTALDGGPGADILALRDTDADAGLSLGHLACGSGTDLVQWPGLALVPVDCERVALRTAPGHFTHPTVTRTEVRLRVVPTADAYPSCGALVVARRARGAAGVGATLTKALRVPRRSWGRGTLRLTLTPAARGHLLRDVVIEVSRVARCAGRGGWAPVARSRASVRLAVASTARPTVAETADALAKPCRPGQGERVLARSPQVVLTGYGRIGLFACVRATGRRRLLNHSDAEVNEFASASLSGSHVAFVEVLSDHYGSTTEELILVDAVRGGPPRHIALADPEQQEPRRTRAVVLDRSDEVAWLDVDRGQHTLLTWRPGDVVRVVDAGFALTHVVLVPGMLRWQHGGVPRTAATAPPDRCATSGRQPAWQAVDVLVQADGSTAVCLRSTGTTATLPDAKPFDVVDSAGTWVVARPLRGNAARIDVVDLSTGSRRTIAASSAAIAVVDAAGSVAWGEQVGSLSAAGELWVDDGGGTRRVATGVDIGVNPIRDGPVVRWNGGGSTVLTP